MNVSCPDCRSIFRVDPAKVPPSGVRARCSVCSGVTTIPAPTAQTTPSGASARTAAPAAVPVERPQSAPSAPGGWDSPPYGTARQTPSTAPAQRPAPAPQPPRTARAESPGRGPVTATATPAAPANSLPEFTSPPPVPPFTPPAAAPAPISPFTPPTGSAPVPPAPPFRPSAPPGPPPSARPPATPPGAAPALGDGGARRPLNPFLSKDPNQRAKRLARALVSDIITYHPAKHAEGLRDGTLKQLFREEIKKSFEEYIAQVGQQLAESTTYFQEALNEVLGAGKKIF